MSGLSPALTQRLAEVAPLTASLLQHLAAAALQGSLFVLAVWLVCRCAPRLPASTRCALWWLACLKLVLGLALPAAVPLPVLRPAVVAVARSEAASRSVSGSGATSLHLPSSRLAGSMNPAAAPITGIEALTGPAREADPAPAVASTSASTAMAGWALALLAVWWLGMAVQGAGVALEMRRLRGALRASAPVREDGVRRLAADIGAALGLRRAVDLRTLPSTGGLRAPFTAGIRHPVVVLPAEGLGRMTQQELAMTLGHELAHVQRHDLLWGWIPVIASRLFFFLPPAAWAAREYALAREAACDAAVLRLPGTAPAAYGRLLLRLGITDPSDFAGSGIRRRPGHLRLPPAAGTVAGAASSVQQLKRRLEMLQNHPPLRPAAPPTRPTPLRRLAWGLFALLTVAALVPLRFVAASPTTGVAATAATAPASLPGATAAVAPPPPTSPVMAPVSMQIASSGSSTTQTTTRLTTAEPGDRLEAAEATEAAEAVDADDRDDARMENAPPVPPVPPVPPTSANTPGIPPLPDLPALAAPPPPPPPPVGAGHEHRHTSTNTYSYSTGTAGGDEYVLLQGDDKVTMSGDSDDIERAQALRRAHGGDLLWVRRDGREYAIRDAATLAAVKAAMRPVHELGEKQGKAGAHQGEMGGKQGELGAEQAAMAARQAELANRLAHLATEQKDPAEQQALGEQMRQLGEQMRRLADQQRAMADQQRKAAGEQRTLASEERRAADDAQRRIHILIEQAIAHGTAQPVK